MSAAPLGITEKGQHQNEIATTAPVTDEGTLTAPKSGGATS